MHDTSERRWEGDTMARGKNNEKKSQKEANRKPNKKQEDNIAPNAAGEKAADDTKVKAEAKALKDKDAAASKKRGKTKNKSKLCKEYESGEKRILLEGWVRDGLTMEDIANNIGISRSTLYEWMRLSSDISDTIKKGKDIPDYVMENALYASGIGGNVLAQIFWLKNRRPDKWRDKVEQKIDQRIDADIDDLYGVLICPPRRTENE